MNDQNVKFASLTGRPSFHRLVVFEGVDGSGKTTLATALRDHYKGNAANGPIHLDSFPGSVPGTLGEWVYRLHHGQVASSPAPENIAAPALQLLHIASHVDTILGRIRPVLERGGSVILDRYWWSTYAYSRLNIAEEHAWAIVNAERVFWQGLPAPTVIYLSRRESLKPMEIDAARHRRLDSHYQEVIVHERAAGTVVHELSNDDSLAIVWKRLLALLSL